MHIFSRCKHPHRKSVLSAGSIIFCITSLIFLSGCSLTPNGGVNSFSASTPTPTTSPPTPTPTPVSQPTTLRDIHMVNAANGWAMTQDKTHLLHTTSGVIHWLDVTPNTQLPKYTLGTAFFLDAFNAWVTVQSGTGKFSIYATNNGGQSWLEAPLLDIGVGVSQISFVDPLNGWCLFDTGSAAGSEGVDVLHTIDGGMTWGSVSSASGQSLATQNSLPLGGDKTGLSFLNTTTGWVTGTEPVDNFVWLYKTQDSGSTWQPQTLPLPSGSAGQATTMPPVFFNAKSGIMPVQIYEGNGSKLTIYVTTDAGKSWLATSTVPGSSPFVAFNDIDHGWAIGNNTTPLAVYATSDGGHHWSQLTPKLGSGITNILQLDFISSTDGWAIGSTASNSIILLQTTNGGKTWMQVQPLVS